MTSNGNLHERICRLMRDGKARSISEVMADVGSTYNGVYPILSTLELEDALKVIKDPVTGLRMFAWNDA